MPNWCEGILKVRGTKENIKSWLLNELISVNYLGEQVKKEIVMDEEDIFRLECLTSSFYINNSSRAFIETSIEIYWDDCEEDVEQIIVLGDFKQAWAIEVDCFVEHSKKYQLGFRVYGFEMGMEFNQDIEVVKGEIIKNEVVKFRDYDWECINPKMGG